MCLGELLGGSLEGPWGLLEVSLGGPWGVLRGLLGGFLGVCLGSSLRCNWGVLGLLGVSVGGLGESLGVLWGVLGGVQAWEA